MLEPEHNLSKDELEQYNLLVRQFNALNPDHQMRLITHAKNNDHAHLSDWVRSGAHFFGLGISPVGIAGITKYLMQTLKGL
jgi:hypothetical protein